MMQLQAFELSYTDQDGGYGRYVVQFGDTHTVEITTDGDSGNAEVVPFSNDPVIPEWATVVPFDTILPAGQREALRAFAAMIW
jgi:hypothetical protein